MFEQNFPKISALIASLYFHTAFVF